MEAAVFTLLALVLASQGAIWHRLGRVEGLVNGHLQDHTREG